MTAQPAIRFHFDYISSNAYLAWLELPKLAERHGRRIETVPTLFAGLLGAHGQLGPAEIPAKAAWMFRNNLRKAALLGIPLNAPVHHPFNPLLALRVSAEPESDDERARAIGALFRAVWVDRLHVSDPAVVARALDGVGLRGAELVARAQGDAAKQRLRVDTDAAIARGVFGVPTMLVGDELFWGYDDFAFLDQHLAGKDPLTPDAVTRWAGKILAVGDAPRGAARAREEGLMAARPKPKARPKRGIRWSAVRKLALSFPGVTEGSSYGEPAFLLDGKFFSRFNEKEQGLVVLAEEPLRDALLASKPDIYFTTDHYRGYPMLLARLERAQASEIAALYEAAFRARAKRASIVGHEAGARRR